MRLSLGYLPIYLYQCLGHRKDFPDPSETILDKTVFNRPVSEVKEAITLWLFIWTIPTSFSGLSLSLPRAIKFAASRCAHNRVGFESPFREYSELS